jgi:hypothetical protein
LLQAGRAPADIALKVARGAARLGLRDTRTEVLHGLQDAIVVHARTTDIRQTAEVLSSEPQVLEQILGSSPTDYEGVFVEIDDADGNPVYANGLTGSNGSSMVWAGYSE